MEEVRILQRVTKFSSMQGLKQEFFTIFTISFGVELRLFVTKVNVLNCVFVRKLQM